MAEDLSGLRRRTYGVHFAVAYFVLAAILGAAVGGFVVLVDRKDSAKTEWSAWAPNGSADERVEKITNHVASKYRLPSGNQLVGVLAQPPSIVRDGQQLPIRGFGFATPSPTTGRPNVAFARADGSVEYILCGMGSTDCSIGEDEATPERLRLLKREALELALYTFRYVDGVESIFALLPPKPGDEPSLGLYFKRSDLADELEHPIRRTLPATPPHVVDRMSPIEQTVVSRLTAKNFFRFQYQQVSDGSYVLVLAPARA